MLHRPHQIDPRKKLRLLGYLKLQSRQNQPLMDILRKQWGFDGLVVTDWGGNNDRVAGLLAGNALEMPSTGGITDAGRP